MIKGEIQKIDNVKYLDKDFKVLTRSVFSKRTIVSCVNNNASTIHDTTKEKRFVNELIATYFLKPNMKVLDAYAGYGMTTYLWLKSGCRVLAVEENRDNCELLLDNLDEFLGKRKLRTMNHNNIDILNSLIDKGEKFDLIDLDPYSNCYEQIPLALKLIDNGFLLVTTGEPSILYRKFHYKAYKRRYNLDDSFFTYQEFWKFPKDFLFNKYIKQQTDKNLELVHCILSKIIGRLIIKVGNPKIDEKLIIELSKRHRVFGDVKVYEGQKKLENL